MTIGATEASPPGCENTCTMQVSFTAMAPFESTTTRVNSTLSPASGVRSCTMKAVIDSSGEEAGGAAGSSVDVGALVPVASGVEVAVTLSGVADGVGVTVA